MFFIAVPLLAILWSSLWEISFVQAEHLEIGTSGAMFRYDNWPHQAGFSNLALALIGLLILLIPYRKTEPWAFVALAVVMICYLLPTYFFPFSVPGGGLGQILRHLQSSRTISLAAVNFYRYLLAVLALAGLALAVPRFIAGRQSTQLERH